MTYKEALKRLYPKPDGTVLTLTAGHEAEKWDQQYQLAAADSREADKLKVEAQNHLKAIAGDHTYIKFADGSGYSMKLQSREERTQAAFEFRDFRRSKKLKVQQ